MSNGGYRAGRRRVTVEACVRVDLGMFRRAGLLAGDTANGWIYSNRGEKVCTIVATSRLAESVIELSIVRAGEPVSSKQRVRLSWASCHYGGRRAWLHCPLCDRRAWRLFFYMHVYNGSKRSDFFACRRCLPLTYELRNVRGCWLWHARQQKVTKKLGGSFDELPQKKKWQRWRTYARLAQKWKQAARAYEDATMVKFAWLLGLRADE